MNKDEMYKVYPTEPVLGFCVSYCLTETSAEWTKLRNEMASGVDWKIRKPIR